MFCTPWTELMRPGNDEFVTQGDETSSHLFEACCGDQTLVLLERQVFVVKPKATGTPCCLSSEHSQCQQEIHLMNCSLVDDVSCCLPSQCRRMWMQRKKDAKDPYKGSFVRLQMSMWFLGWRNCVISVMKV